MASEPLVIPERYKHAHSTLVGRRTKVCTLGLTWTDEQIISFIEEIARLEAEVKFLKSAPCPFEAEVAALKAQAEWTLIDPSMRLTKHHVLAYPQDGLSSDDTYVMAYSGGYRTGQHALDDNWKYVKKLERPINAPQEPA